MGGSSTSLPAISVDNDLPPIVKQGVYQFAFVEYRTALMFGGKAPKVIMWFRVVTQGEYFGVLLARYYNVTKLIGKHGRNGRFKPAMTGDFLREYYTLFQGNHRLDRIPMTPFKTALIEGKAEIVKRGRGRDIPDPLQYSRIAKLIRVVS